PLKARRSGYPDQRQESILYSFNSSHAVIYSLFESGIKHASPSVLISRGLRLRFRFLALASRVCDLWSLLPPSEPSKRVRIPVNGHGGKHEETSRDFVRTPNCLRTRCLRQSDAEVYNAEGLGKRFGVRRSWR